MKKALLSLIIFVVASVTLSCSNDDSTTTVNNQLPLKEFKITINGVLDGDYTNYPNPTENSFIASYLKDGAEETVTYTEALTNELILEKVKTITARNSVGLKLNINQEQTRLYSIKVKIEDVESETVIYENQLNKSLVANNPDAHSTLEIKVLYDVVSDEATVSQ